MPVAGFWNGKSLKDYSFRAKLLKLEESGIWKPCGKKYCLFCDSISTNTTFTTKAYQETFKIQKVPLNCDSENVLYLLKCKVCDEVPYAGKAKTKFYYRFNNHKSKHRAFRKANQNVLQKSFHNHDCLDCHTGIKDWDFVIFGKFETHEQLQEKETFWQHGFLLDRFKWKGGVLDLTQAHILIYSLRFQLIWKHLFIYLFIYFIVLSL